MTKSVLTFKDKREITLRFKDLLESCRRCASPEDQEQIKSAFLFAYIAHQGMRRKTGEAFILHPISVAKIVAYEIGLDTTAVVAALLHDVVEDSDYTYQDIQRRFGDKVANIVQGLTKITNISAGKTTLQAENFKKMLMTISEDIRVIFIKIADRLHNMRTLEGMTDNKQFSKAAETLYVYAPLARKLGLYSIKNELENHCFKYRHSESAKELKEEINRTRQQRVDVYEEFKERIAGQFESNDIRAMVQMKTKSRYQTWLKMQSEGIKFADIDDFHWLRIVFKSTESVSERDECFRILAIITKEFIHKEGSMIDWTSLPNSNGYEAIHVTIMIGGKWQKVQILSQRMHDIAKRGVTIHNFWNEENGNGSSSSKTNTELWIEKIVKRLQLSSSDTLEALDDASELISSDIYVFTPKGDIISLPKDSTVLDMAFEIHTDMGYRCIGANINNTKTVGRTHVLQNTDQVEILTANNAGPKEDWLDSVRSSKAKSALKSYFKKEKNKIINEGKAKLDKYAMDFNLNFSVAVNKLVEYTRAENANDVFYFIGKESITDNELDKILRPGFLNRIFGSGKSSKSTETKVKEETGKKIDELFDRKQPFVINEEIPEEYYQIAPCCNPIPGDSAVAYKINGNKLEVHKTQCNHAIKLNATEGSHTVKVIWKSLKNRHFKTSIKLLGTDRKNMVKDIVKVISEEKDINMKAINIEANAGVFNGHITLYVLGINDLNNTISKLKNVNGIHDVERNGVVTSVV